MYKNNLSKLIKSNRSYKEHIKILQNICRILRNVLLISISVLVTYFQCLAAILVG